MLGTRFFLASLVALAISACQSAPTRNFEGAAPTALSPGGGMGRIGGNPGGNGKTPDHTAHSPQQLRSFLTDLTGKDASSVAPTESAPMLRPAQVLSHPIAAHQDIFRSLMLDPATTFASISTNDWQFSNGAYALTNQRDMFIKRGIRYKHHSTSKDVLRNITEAPAGTKTIFLSSHGCSGASVGFDISNVDVLAAALKNRGIKRVVMTSCWTGYGEAGRAFLQKLSDLSGAEAFAVDNEIWSSPESAFVQNDSTLRHAIPGEPAPTTPAAQVRRTQSTERASAEPRTQHTPRSTATEPL